MKIYLIRHPDPEVEPGVCYGRLDLSPRNDALEQAIERVQRLVPAGLHVLSSPLLRCRALTESLLQAGHWHTHGFDERLQEMDFGQWEGQRWDDIGAEAVEQWRLDLLNHRPPGGEALADVVARCRGLLDEIMSLSTDPDDAVVLVTHAGPIQVMNRLLQNLPMEGFGGTRLDYGSVSLLHRSQGETRVLYYNQR